MEAKRENFKRIATARTNKIIDAISKLENLSNVSFYEYDDSQIDAIFNAIQNELDVTREKFKKKGKKNKKFEL